MEVDSQEIPQSQPLSADQVLNAAGGYTWKVDDMTRLRRFLCLGSEGGTYYISEKKLGMENAQCIMRMIESGKGEEVVKEVKEFSVNGRTAKQNPTLFALALCARQCKQRGTKRAAYKVLSDICRIPTHLFTFVEYSELLSKGTGWGRAQRNAIGHWYNRFKKEPKRLAQHVTKYKNRNGWTHTDVLRLAHPKPSSDAVGAVLRYVVKGMDKSKEMYEKPDADPSVQETFGYLDAVEKASKTTDEDEMMQLIAKYGLVREHIPTQLLNSKKIWLSLLEDMPMTAMLRNLAKMTSIDVLTDSNDATRKVVSRLQDSGALRKAKIHPFSVLLALNTYKRGKGFKGSLAWKPIDKISKALDGAFYMSFKFVEPTNQRYLLAVDVSGSMDGFNCIGAEGVTARDGAVAMSMLTARTEAGYEMVAFTGDLTEIPITPEWDIQKTTQYMQNLDFGCTDCAQPMLWAKEKDKKFDVFIVYTDNDTWAGHMHAAEALRQYRQHSGIWTAKLIVVGMASNEFTIADPEDPGMLDIAGFDASAPEVMRNFVLGLI